ncbi:MAG: hypothetical protein ACRELF_00925 [Gemmataceae bacterium]
MTASTSLRSKRLVPFVGIAIVLGTAAPTYCQGPRNYRRPTRLKKVAVFVEDAQKRIWRHVNISNDGGFIAKRFHPDDRAAAWQHNFRPPGPNWVMIDGFLLGYDLEGKSKNVLWRGRDRESTCWEIERGRRFSMRMRVRNGSLKGWWVGLKLIKEKPEPGKPAQARLVLVEDKKDAAVFTWEDPTDISP